MSARRLAESNAIGAPECTRPEGVLLPGGAPPAAVADIWRV